jgi:TonB family protein
VVSPPSSPFRSRTKQKTFDREFSQQIFSSLRDDLREDSYGRPSRNLDESTALSYLKELIAAGDHRLDPMLATLTDAACRLTGATGAALAMWKDGAMMCRARSGETAPAIGARLSADTGISGECLRTGNVQNCADTENDPLVDVEVCRRLGLRSIAVLPIPGWRGINGILEVFSTKPAAFTEQNIELLQQLAALAERARAARPHGASSSAPRQPSAIEKQKPKSSLLPASDRFGDMAMAYLGTRSRSFVLGIGLVAISLIGLAIWLGWRGAEETESGASRATAMSTNQGLDPGVKLGVEETPMEIVVGSSVVGSSGHASDKHALDDDPVWKPNPGGEPLFPTNAKPSPGMPLKFAAKIDRIGARKIMDGRSALGHGQVASHRAPLLADVADKVPAGLPASPVERNSEAGARDIALPALAASDLAGSDMTHRSAPNVVPLSTALMPEPVKPVPQGISGGQVIHRITPVYPSIALEQRLEGTVILSATVVEDGTLRNVKVVEGEAALGQSAVDAVKQWRYKPFEVDGRPVKNEIRVSVDFQLPQSRQ